MPARPDIVFIFSDQQRWDTLGCYGQRLPVTPNLDRLAAEGVRFENAFTCQPVCGPARACLQTGRYATEVGCWRNGIALPLDEKGIAHYASEAGYEVGYVGKWHLASTRSGIGMEEVDYRTRPVPPERRGGWKDYWVASDVLEFTSHGHDGHMFDADMNTVPFQGYRVDCLTDFVLRYLRSRDGRRPFFLFVSQSPYYWLALTLVYIFGFYLRWFPLGRAYSPTFTFSLSLNAITEVLRHYTLPFLSVMLPYVGGEAIGMRSLILYEMGSDYANYCESLGFNKW